MSWLSDFLMLVLLLSPSSEPCEVLDALDARREAAWVAGDRDGLAAVYTDSEADLAQFDAWAERGVRVSELSMERSECEVVDSAPEVVRLRVVERMGSAVAEGRDLPDDHWSQREITLVHDGLWRIQSVE